MNQLPEPPPSSADNAPAYRFILALDSESPTCFRMEEKLRQLCQRYLRDAFSLEVIDLQAEPSAFERLRIIAVPTLEVISPRIQKRRFVGDLSQSEVFIMALGMGQEAAKMQQLAAKMRASLHRGEDVVSAKHEET
jgi:hypothetical protein